MKRDFSWFPADKPLSSSVTIKPMCDNYWSATSSIKLYCAFQ